VCDHCVCGEAKKSLTKLVWDERRELMPLMTVECHAGWLLELCDWGDGVSV